MNVQEIVSSAMEPANKLIDAVTGAIGKVYEPRYVKKMADAKAYEISKIGEQLRCNADLPIIYETTGDFSVDISNYEELIKRTSRRIAYQEVIKQENMESVIDNAYDSLKDKREVIDGEVSREWMLRFLDSAGDISTEDLQKLWGKVLAGEVMNPKTFSLRTLECLRNLDVEDAKLFEKICELVITNRFVLNDDVFLRKHGMPYGMILKLDECGLINSSATISASFEVGKEPTPVIDFGEYILMARAEEKKTLRILEFPLTAAGRELSTIVGSNMDIVLVKEICSIVARNNINVNLSLHKVNFRGHGEINYENEAVSF